VFVFQATDEAIKQNQGEFEWSRNLTFAGNPDKTLYVAVGAEASLWRMLISINSSYSKQIPKVYRPILTYKLIKNKYIGGEQHTQMPADFLIDSASGEVLAAKYGQRFYDRWSAEEVACN
jgi:hypothetical protein